MPSKRSIARGSVRVLVGIIGTGVAAAALAAAALLPLPQLHVAPVGQAVTPVPADQQRVCPGGLLDQSDPTSATSFSSFGSPSIEKTATTAIKQISLSTPSVQGGPGAPRVISTQTSGATQRPLIAGAQSQVASESDIAGLAAASCGEASADSWLVAGSTTLGSTSLVLLSNPSAVQDTVNLTVYSEAGVAQAPAARGIVVRAGSQLVVPLAGVVPNAQASVVRVQSTGGTIYASLQQSAVQGLAPQGVELVEPTASPARNLVIPGMVVANTARLSGGAEGASSLLPSVRLLATGTSTVHATVTATSESGKVIVATAQATLQGGAVREVSFDHIIDGSYTVRVSADGPVVAAARTVDAAAAPSSAESATAQAEAATQDFAWFVASSPLEDTALLAVPSGGSPKLHLSNTTAKDASVTLMRPGTSSRSLKVPAHAAIAVAVTGSASYTLRGAKGLRASVSLTSDGASSSFALNPPGPSAQPITVYPR
ncbi:DUF5719 family protein [Humibacter sp. RRB41]|uniref:DUF5719 family protein n=1 Tax=Humibacter sp. RRB41 TaxID=2919946 RepID=UPI001FA9E960|nr:DUF5719 family protein [Humibacter sp. RRB41]